MTIQRRAYVYDGPGGPFEGVVAWDDAASAPRPGVMIVANVLGQKEFDNARAEALAALGYVGFACDVYGQAGGRHANRKSRRCTWMSSTPIAGCCATGSTRA